MEEALSCYNVPNERPTLFADLDFNSMVTHFPATCGQLVLCMTLMRVTIQSHHS